MFFLLALTFTFQKEVGMKPDPEFDPKRTGFLGVEVECGLFQMGRPVPLSPKFMARIGSKYRGKWVMELPAWQVEYATPPCRHLAEVRKHLGEAIREGREVASMLGVQLRACEVAPDERWTYIPSPKPRYQRITSELPKWQWGPGCRVAGTHVHYGCRNLEHALEVYNRLAEEVEHFCEIGAHPAEEGPSRLELYREMAPTAQPPLYDSVDEWRQRAQDEGFASDLGDCWHLVRISEYGTVEVRCFGITLEVDELVGYTEEVRRIARGG